MRPFTYFISANIGLAKIGLKNMAHQLKEFY